MLPSNIEEMKEEILCGVRGRKEWDSKEVLGSKEGEKGKKSEWKLP